MTDELIMMPISAECGSFLGCCVAGAALALTFSLINAAEKGFGFTGISAVVLDFFFCINCGYFAFSLLMRYCSGNIGGYLLIGLALGAVIFSALLGEYVTEAFSELFGMIKRCFFELLRLLFIPVLRFKVSICEALRKFSQLFRKIAKKVWRNRKFCLKIRLKS